MMCKCKVCTHDADMRKHTSIHVHMYAYRTNIHAMKVRALLPSMYAHANTYTHLHTSTYTRSMHMLAYRKSEEASALHHPPKQLTGVRRTICKHQVAHCMYVCAHVCLFMFHIYIYIYIYTHTYIHMYIYTC
jgi:hypothetical protein